MLARSAACFSSISRISSISRPVVGSMCVRDKNDRLLFSCAAVVQLRHPAPLSALSVAVLPSRYTSLVAKPQEQSQAAGPLAVLRTRSVSAFPGWSAGGDRSFDDALSAWAGTSRTFKRGRWSRRASLSARGFPSTQPGTRRATRSRRQVRGAVSAEVGQRRLRGIPSRPNSWRMPRTRDS